MIGPDLATALAYIERLGGRAAPVRDGSPASAGLTPPSKAKVYNKGWPDIEIDPRAKKPR